jgi:hypothetical protein
MGFTMVSVMGIGFR